MRAFALVIVTHLMVNGTIPRVRAMGPTADDEKVVERYIRELGDKDFKVRADAVRRLTALEPYSALVRALKANDAEAARLAAQILNDLDRAATVRSLQKLPQETARGEVSRVTDRFARWKGPENDEKAWQINIDFAWEVANRAVKDFANEKQFWKDRYPPRSTKPYGPKGQVEYLYSKDALTASKSIIGFARADGIIFKRGAKPMGVFVSSNGLELGRDLVVNSTFLIVGALRCDATISNCILICDGAVELQSSVLNSVIVANGPVKYSSSVAGCTVISTSSIIATTRGSADRSVLRENEPNPLGFIKWFKPSEVGIEVVAAKDAVRVERLHDGRLPLKAGVKMGDLVTAIDGTKIESTETFRRRLLRGVVNERCNFTIKRGDSKMEVFLDFRAEERAKQNEKK